MNHTIAQLEYSLIDGRFSLSPLRVLASRTLNWNGWSVTFSVLGASHAVRLERQEHTVTELLTCLPVSSLQALVRVAVQECGSACTAIHSLCSATVLSQYRLDAPLTPAWQEHDTLSVTFPSGSHPAGAVTRISWRASGTALLVSTIHTYPEEGLGVYSETRFTSEGY